MRKQWEDQDRQWEEREVKRPKVKGICIKNVRIQRDVSRKTLQSLSDSGLVLKRKAALKRFNSFYKNII